MVDVMEPWLQKNSEQIADWFSMLREQHSAANLPSAEDLWDLYAFSRVNDLLLIDFQPVNPNYLPHRYSDWLDLSLDHYVEIITRCGLEIRQAEPRFSPFFHELVEVEICGDLANPYEIIGEFWPAVTNGNLLISRAGARVLTNGNCANATVATNSTLYWQYDRRYRETSDLSHGWGSNSQWRTALRCDFIEGEIFHFNARGSIDISGEFHDVTCNQNDGASPHEVGIPISGQASLLLHRCQLTNPVADEVWPYDLRFSGTVQDVENVLVARTQ